MVPSPNMGTHDNSLTGVAVVSSSDVWAVGQYVNGTMNQTLAEHWDGSAWIVVPSDNVGTHANGLNGVTVVSAADVWAVGNYDLNGSFLDQALVERYNPCSPTPTPLATPTACSIQFSDVPQGSTFYDYVRCIACRGIVNGYNDGTFKPNNNVTRGQLSKIDANAAGFNDDPTGQQFEDVAPGSPYYTYTYRLVSRSIMAGYMCGGVGEPCVPPDNLLYFRPNNNATRGQTSKIVSNTETGNEQATYDKHAQ